MSRIPQTQPEEVARQEWALECQEDMQETELMRRRRQREAEKHGIKKRPIQLPVIPPPRISVEMPKIRRVPEGAKVLKEPLDLLQRKRKEQEAKNKQVVPPEKGTTGTSSSEEDIGPSRKKPTREAVYVDRKMWDTLEERYAIQNMEARQYRAIGIMLT